MNPIAKCPRHSSLGKLVYYLRVERKLKRQDILTVLIQVYENHGITQKAVSILLARYRKDNKLPKPPTQSNNLALRQAVATLTPLYPPTEIQRRLMLRFGYVTMSCLRNIQKRHLTPKAVFTSAQKGGAEEEVSVSETKIC